MSEFTEMCKWIGWTISAGLIILSIPMLARRHLLYKKRDYIRNCINILHFVKDKFDTYQIDPHWVSSPDKCDHLITTGADYDDEYTDNHITFFYVNLREWKI